MKKLMLVGLSVSLAASFAAHAGPLANVEQNAPAALPRVAAGVSAMPKLSMPSLGATNAALPGLAAAGGGPGPLKQYWFVYNTTQYPTDVKNWAVTSRKHVFQNVVQPIILQVQDPCYDGGDACGPTDQPDVFVQRAPGIVNNAADRILGLGGGGGVGPIPLPKRPGEQPPAEGPAGISGTNAKAPAVDAAPGAGAGPLKQYWFQYNTTQYPKDVQKWAANARKQVVVDVVNYLDYVQDPCQGEGSCGPTEPDQFAAAIPSVINHGADVILGLGGGGGIGPIPLPKRPGDQPPAGSY